MHEAQAAFRALCKQLHPDVCSSAAGHRRFVEVVTAYRTLRTSFAQHPQGMHRGPCPRCGREDELLDALSGGLACGDCLLGLTWRRRLLPGQLVAVARHLLVIALYLGGTFLFVQYLRTEQFSYALASWCATQIALISLVSEVLKNARANPRRRRARRQRGRRPASNARSSCS